MSQNQYTRTVNEHVVPDDPNSAALTITVVDEPSHGGANHRYLIDDNQTLMPLGHIKFQEGPIAEHGINGITNEVLLAVVIDRLKSFQAGPFACKENAEALHYATMAIDWLKQRTADRIARNVEGKSEP